MLKVPDGRSAFREDSDGFDRICYFLQEGCDVREAVWSVLTERRKQMKMSELTKRMNALGVSNRRIQQFGESAFAHAKFIEGEGQQADSMKLLPKNILAIRNVSLRGHQVLLSLDALMVEENEESPEHRISALLNDIIRHPPDAEPDESWSDRDTTEGILAARRLGELFDEHDRAILTLGVLGGGGKVSKEELNALHFRWGQTLQRPAWSELEKPFAVTSRYVALPLEHIERDTEKFRRLLAHRLEGLPKLNALREEQEHYTSNLLTKRGPQPNGDMVRIRGEDGEWMVVPASTVFQKNAEKKQGPDIIQKPRGVTLAELESLPEYEKLPDAQKLPPPLRIHPLPELPVVLDDETFAIGEKALKKMRDTLRSCLESTKKMQKADFLSSFGPHLLHAARCIEDAKRLLVTMEKDQWMLDAAEKVLTYGLHATAEYVTLESMQKKRNPSWKKIPLYREHPEHWPFVAALVREALKQVNEQTDHRRAPNIFTLTDITGETFLAKHFSTKENMTFGAHVRSLIKAGEEVDIPDDDDTQFEPEDDPQWQATDAPAGSSEKLELLRSRWDEWQYLWHSKDRIDFTGLTAAIDPRED